MGTTEATGGVVNWRHSGTANLGFGSLQCAGEAAGTFLVSAGYSSIDVSTFSPPYGDGVTLSYSGVGEVQFAQLGTDVITYAGNVPERYAPHGQLAFRNWLMTNALIPPATYDKVITDANGNLVLRGDARSGPFKWHWEFKQLRTAR